MGKIIATSFALVLTAGAAMSQGELDSHPDFPDGAVQPRNLNELGTTMRDRMTEIVFGDIEQDAGDAGEDVGLSLFSGSSGEDPNILEIKKIARELESQRALMNQIADLQRDLIDFAMADAVAAYQSRIPSNVCEYALEQRFCDAMTSSFRPHEIIIRKD